MTTAGTTYCWGTNGYGQLGNDANLFTLAPNPQPLRVAGNLGFATVNPGNLVTCALTAQGAGYCWGNNSDGALGDGTLRVARADAYLREQLLAVLRGSVWETWSGSVVPRWW